MPRISLEADSCIMRADGGLVGDGITLPKAKRGREMIERFVKVGEGGKQTRIQPA